MMYQRWEGRVTCPGQDSSNDSLKPGIMCNLCSWWWLCLQQIPGFLSWKNTAQNCVEGSMRSWCGHVYVDLNKSLVCEQTNLQCLLIKAQVLQACIQANRPWTKCWQKVQLLLADKLHNCLVNKCKLASATHSAFSQCNLLCTSELSCPYKLCRFCCCECWWYGRVNCALLQQAA